MRVIMVKIVPNDPLVLSLTILSNKKTPFFLMTYFIRLHDFVIEIPQRVSIFRPS